MLPETLRVTFRAALAALALVPTATPAGIRLPQTDGTELILQQTAQRIITLSPHLTELVYAAGAGERLVATVAFSNYPPAAAAQPQVGDAFRLDLERIVMLRPDLVIAWDSGNPRPAIARLQALGIPTWVTEIRRPGGIAVMLERIGEAAGTAGTARAAAATVRASIRSLRSEYAGRPEVRYFYQVDARPLYTINDRHLIARSLALCGGRNVFADTGSLAPQVTRESVIAADPAVMLAPSLDSGDDPLAAWRAWPTLDAVRNHALYQLPADEISRATPRLLDAVALACRLMHGRARHAAPEAAGGRNE